MKLGGTTKIFVLLEFSNRIFSLCNIKNKGGTIMKSYISIISYKAMAQVIVPAFTFGFFPAGK